MAEKEKMINIRADERLREDLKVLCEKQGITYSDWLRRKIEEDVNAEQTSRELEELRAECRKLTEENDRLKKELAQGPSKEEVERLREEVERRELAIEALERELEGAISISSQDRVILSYVFEQYKALMPGEYNKADDFRKWIFHSVWAFHRNLGYVLGVSLGPYTRIATPLDEVLSKALRVSEKTIEDIFAKYERYKLEVIDILDGVLSGRLKIVEVGKLEPGKRDTNKFTVEAKEMLRQMVEHQIMSRT